MRLSGDSCLGTTVVFPGHREPWRRGHGPQIPCPPVQTGPEDCLHQCGLRMTVFDWYKSSDFKTWTITCRRPYRSSYLARLWNVDFYQKSSILSDQSVA